jgi:hypothetical protein
VLVAVVTAQGISSITIVTALVEEAKLVPVIVSTVFPVLGPKAGVMLVITDVEVS